MIFMLRRAVYVSIAVIPTEYYWLQIQCLILMTCFYMIYIGRVKPNLSSKAQKLELFNEFITLILTYQMCLFTDFVPDSMVQYNVGYGFQGVTLFMIVTNIMIMFQELIKPIMDKWRHKKITDHLKVLRAAQIEINKKKKIQKKIYKELKAKEFKDMKIKKQEDLEKRKIQLE